MSLSDSSKSLMEAERIEGFRSITGASEQEARQFLDAAGWDNSRAVDLYYASDGPSNYKPQPSGRGLFMPDKSSRHVVAPPSPTPPPPSAAPAAASTRPKPTSSEKPRIMSVSDLSNDDDGDGDDKGQSFYTGGDQSGLEVFDPTKNRRSAATLVEDEPSKPASPAHFTGVGRKLGEPAAAALARSPTPTTAASPPEPVVTIKFWKNGFTVDDNPVRAYAEPQNVTFLNEIREGHIPRELYRGRARVEVTLVDCKDRNWEAPKPVVKPFSGSGKRLGSTGPTLAQVQASGATSSVATATATATAPSAAAPAGADSSAPQTTVQIRLSGGERLVAHFHVTQTVGEIYDFVRAARPQTANFLLTTFPNIPLNDKTQTIRNAQLEDAAITQKLL